MNQNFQTIRHFLLFALFMVFSVVLSGQVSVRGTVTDAMTNEPLPGASVRIEGTDQGTITDIDGNYQLQSVETGAVLVFSYVGYNEFSTSLGGRTQIDVVLQLDVQTLSEMVVIGYGTVEKDDLTGSVSVVTSEDLNRIPSGDFSRALQGRASGVMVNQTGNPGENAQIRVRGIGSITRDPDPIYVVDGVITDNIAFLNPNDIETIQVLKDASASAIYGADGANGVIIVNTKRGEAGKTKVSYNSFASMNLVPRQFDVMNAREYSEFYSQLISSSGEQVPYAYSDEFRQLYYGDGWETGTDWQDEMTRTAIGHNHSLNISGGNEFSNFSISGNYFS